MKNYVVATVKDWNVEQFNINTPILHGQWTLITNKESLTLQHLQVLEPEFIFFHIGTGWYQKQFYLHLPVFVFI